jgi:hypothetical protein
MGVGEIFQNSFRISVDTQKKNLSAALDVPSHAMLSLYRILEPAN